MCNLLLLLLFTPLEFFTPTLADGLSLEFEWLLFFFFYSLEFFTSALANGFSLELSDSKSPQISRTRLRILAVLSNADVWIVSTRPPTSKSSGPFNSYCA